MNSKEWLSVENGVINIQTQEFRARCKEDHITSYYPVKYDLDVNTEELVTLFKQIMGDQLNKFKDALKKLILNKESLSISFQGATRFDQKALLQLIQSTFSAIRMPLKTDNPYSVLHYNKDTIYMIEGMVTTYLTRENNSIYMIIQNQHTIQMLRNPGLVHNVEQYSSALLMLLLN